MDGRNKKTSHEIRGTSEPPLKLPLQGKTRLLPFFKEHPSIQVPRRQQATLHAALIRAIKYIQTPPFSGVPGWDTLTNACR